MHRPDRLSRTQRLCLDALLCAAALIIFVVEAQIPLPLAVPGLKLGLANVVTLYMLCRFPAIDAFAVLLVRIVLGSVFAGQAASFMFSLGGGLAAFAVMWLFLKLSKGENVWFAGVSGSVAHNFGQILVAMAMYRSVYAAYYFGILMFFGIATGLLTGLTAQLLSRRRKQPPPEAGK